MFLGGFLERESIERERMQPKVNGRGSSTLYRVECEAGGVCCWVCGWLAAHTSVRPHTPLLVCLAGFCDATPFLILPKVHIYDILSLKH